MSLMHNFNEFTKTLQIIVLKNCDTKISNTKVLVTERLSNFRKFEYVRYNFSVIQGSHSDLHPLVQIRIRAIHLMPI